MATTSLPTSSQLDWGQDALLCKDLVLSGNMYNATPQYTAGATLSATAATHAGKTILLSALAGSVVTLPALGTTSAGTRFRFIVSALATSASHKIQVANATDVMSGSILISDQDTAGTVTSFVTASTSDTITLNRTTTGSVTKGEWVEVEDIGGNVWMVTGILTNTASGATPFSAAV